MQPLPWHGSHVRNYPDIGTAAIENGEAAAFRVWLLARGTDPYGSGKIDAWQLRSKYTDQKSPDRVFSWRYLRKLIQDGDGRFWRVDKSVSNGRFIYLAGAASLAAMFGLTRLTGSPVLLGMKKITADMGEFKAELYAAWLNGRRNPDAPISRAAQQQATGIPERTQRVYCERANVTRERQIAVVGRVASEQARDNMWRLQGGGGAYFNAKDGDGTAVTIRELPSSYNAPVQRTGRGRKTNINQTLAQLACMPERAQGDEMVEKRFYETAVAAYKAQKNGATGPLWFRGAGQRKGEWILLAEPGSNLPPLCQKTKNKAGGCGNYV